VKVAVLTVSDSVSRGTREDVSGPALRSLLAKEGWTAIADIVPDEQDQIASKLRSWAESGEVDAIFTTGGTGVALRDVTPEATRSVIDREIPGIGEWMRSQGMQKTPLAILSRGIAGTLGKCVIVNLPGSPKGAQQSMESILHVLPHIIDLLRGNTEHGNSRRRENVI
jgi:molybdenum cofactor synthesis domain-containing protein